MAELVRVASLTFYLETMAALGADPRPLLAEQGLSVAMLASPEQLIPATAAIRLLERSAAAAGSPTLGLRMAEGRALANLGVTGLLIAHQPTLRHALAALAEFRARINSTLVLHVEEKDGEVILREDFALQRPEPARQSTDLALGVLMRLCAGILGDGWAPRAVGIAHEAPPRAEQAIYTRLFRCPVQFDSEFDGIVLAAADLDRPGVRADGALAGHARQLLEAATGPADRTATQSVEQLIGLLIPSGRATIQGCAAAMAVSTRTLQRMLDAEGASFSELLTRARMQLATHYLANPRLRVTDIAAMLGYASTGAFSRWHRDAFGTTPLERRAELRQSAAPAQSKWSRRYLPRK